MVPDLVSSSHKKGAGKAPFFALLAGLVAALFWMFAWLNPNHYPPWIVFENEASAFASLLLFCLALYLAGPKAFSGRRLQMSGVMPLWVAGVTVVIAAQYAMGMTSRQQGFMGALYFAALGLSFLAGCHAYAIADEQRSQWEARVCLGFLLTTLLSAGIVLLQYGNVEHWLPMIAAQLGVHRPFGNLGQPNNQATFLVMGLACLDILVRRQKIALWLAALGLCALIPAIAATGSRAGLLGAMCVGFYLWRVGDRKRYWFTPAWVLSLLTLFLLMPLLNKSLGAPVARGVAELVADQPRLQIYTQLLRALTEHPWLGYGFGKTGYAQSQMALTGEVGDPISNAHNLPLDFLLWFGVPLGLLLLFTAVAWIVHTWRNSAPRYRPLFALLLPILVHSMVELPYAYSFFLLTFGFIAGYLAMSVPPVLPIGWKRNHTLLLGLVIAGGGGLVAYDYIQCVEEFSIVRYEHRKVGSVPADHTVYRPLILKDIQGQIDAIRAPVGKDMDPKALDNLAVQALEYHMALAHIKLISHYLMVENVGAAEGELQRFRNLYRTLPETLRWGGETLRNDFCADNKDDAKSASRCALIGRYVP